MLGNPETAQYTSSIRLRNSLSAEMTFYLEPWGEEYSMPSGATFDILAKGPSGGSLEVELADNHIIVVGWPGSILTLLHDGAELGAGLWQRTPVPAIPVDQASRHLSSMADGSEHGKARTRRKPTR